MNTYVGIWIDHRQALIARVTAAGEETLEFRSHANLSGRGGDDRQATEAVAGPPRASSAELNRFYQRVFEAIRDAQEILVFGPGEATGELRRCCQQGQYTGRILVLDTTDRWTSAQVVAKVRGHFPELAAVPQS